MLSGKHDTELSLVTMDTLVVEIHGKLLDELRSSIQSVESDAQTSAIPGAMVFLVDTTHGLKIEIRINEHPPPHFHVLCQGEDASFAIESGRRLPVNRGLERWEPKIQDWWQNNRLTLVERWNSSRPSNCPVGPIGVVKSQPPPKSASRRKTRKKKRTKKAH